MQNNDWKRDLEAYLPPALFAPLALMEPAYAARLEEIRIRARRPVQLLGAGFDLLMETLRPGEAECAELLEALCAHSLYAFERERGDGYITLRGGYRVGLCGRCGAGMSDIAGFNIRIAREWPGCAAGLMPELIQGGRAASALLVSPPGVGKTTMLRDIARQFSEGLACHPHKVAIADERGEIAGSYLGVPVLNVGARTDVMDGCPKARAMQMLIRTMSPDLIITDEIGSAEDAQALRSAAQSGVSVIASAHAADRSCALAKRELRALFDEGIFLRIVELYREDDHVCCRVA